MKLNESRKIETDHSSTVQVWVGHLEALRQRAANGQNPVVQYTPERPNLKAKVIEEMADALKKIESELASLIQDVQ